VREAFFATPGDLSTPTGGYRYDRRVIEGLTKLGWTIRLLGLPGDFPTPSAASLKQTEELLASTPPRAAILFDGLAFGAISAEIVARVPRRYVALVHHPLALETGLSKERAAALHENERATLTHACAIVVTSASTKELLTADFAVAPARITVAEPGTEPARRSVGSGGAPVLLSVGAITPRKGFRVLVEALSDIATFDWHCRLVGSFDRDVNETAALKRLIDARNLPGRITLLGALEEDRLEAEYDRATLFVLPSHFEGYGMAFAEALAHGLPIVACAGGATASTVPGTAGVFVPAGDAAALAAALRRLLTEPAELKRRADAAWAHAQHLPRWRDTAVKISAVLEKVAA
jgi:glycosyltransferase involved in cell wall biosynthesis